MVFPLLIFKLTLGCSSLSGHLFRYLSVYVSCCVCAFVIIVIFVFLLILSLFCENVCSIATFICILDIFNVTSVSSLDKPFRLLGQML